MTITNTRSPHNIVLNMYILMHTHIYICHVYTIYNINKKVETTSMITVNITLLPSYMIRDERYYRFYLLIMNIRSLRSVGLGFRRDVFSLRVE